MADDEGKKGKKRVVVSESLTPAQLATALNKHFGPGSMKMGSDPGLTVERISTGVLTVDEMLRGGIARGRHTELFGPASVAKTTLAYYIMAEAQKRGELVALVDTEKTFDPVFAAHCGVDVDAMAYHEQVHGPRCVDFIEALIRSRLYSVIVVDSIAAIVPLEDIQTDMEASSYGMQQAKLMSKALRKLTAANTPQGTAMVWINQTRDNVGVTFGKKSTTSGGRAMGFYAGTRIELTRIETLTKKGTQVDPTTGEIKARERTPYGHRIQLRVEKDKTGARPMEQSTLVFNYDIGGFDLIEELIYLGRLYGLVEKVGNHWWVEGYENKKVKTGKKKFKSFLKSNPDIADELREWIRNSIDAPSTFDGDDDDDDE